VYENLESEVSALHDELWEQLNLDIQVKGGPKRMTAGRGGKIYSVSSLAWVAKENKVAFLIYPFQYKTRIWS
jgi:hypothetical protein